MPQRANPKLRVKTGCFACKRAKKKCDEVAPVCQRCQLSKQRCEWPRTADLVDRRYRRSISHRSSLQSCSRQSEGSREKCDSLKHTPSEQRHDAATAVISRGNAQSEDAANCETRPFISSLESAMMHDASLHHVHGIVREQFVNVFYRLILLPGCHSNFSNGWLADIVESIPSCPALNFSVLACAASHLYLVSNSALMQRLALMYYSDAITNMSRLLAVTTEPNNHDGLLSSVMLLNVHGCQGNGTYRDIPLHLEAASTIVESRILRSGRANRSFDILATECVLYHMFHASAGLWSDTREPSYHFDHLFWKRAENYLMTSAVYAETSNSLKSPVLGIPLSLLRLALQLCQLYRGHVQLDVADLQEIMSEVQRWEEMLANGTGSIDAPSGNGSGPIRIAEEYCRDATNLYALVVSSLWTKIAEGERPATEEATREWQINHALEILQRHDEDHDNNGDSFTKSYIGNWPIYTLGFLASRPQDREVFQANLRRRWELTKMAQVGRFLKDLEGSTSFNPPVIQV
ncbi:hypothetical protein GGI35DRAFT_472011 [Trichoderma velutinum]